MVGENLLAPFTDRVPTTNLPTRPGHTHRVPSRSSDRQRPVGGLWLALGGVTAVAALGFTVWTKERAHVAQRGGDTAEAVQLTVPAGARAVTYPLPDGTRVTLAPGSTLTSRGTFGDSARTLDLTGEALFNVAASTVPLVVYAAGVRVRDVSTAFVVRALAANASSAPKALVAVTQGEVRVSAGSWQSALHEGQALMVDSTGDHQTLGANVARASVAWTSGALLFDEEPMPSVIERLQRWTGLSISVDASLKDRRLSLALEGEDAERMLEHVAEALGARAAREGDGWTLRLP